MFGQIFLLGLGFTLPVSQWLVGSGRVSGWWICLAGQLVWLGFVGSSGHYGLLPSSLLFLGVCLRNLRNWRRLPDEVLSEVSQ